MYKKQGVQVSDEVIPSVTIYNGSATPFQGREMSSQSSSAIQHNLPQPDYERFIGREVELEQIRKLLLPATRHFVITIDGVGGVGKTALALEAAHICLREHKTLPEEQRFQNIIWITAKRNTLSADGIILRHQAFHTLEDILTLTSRLLSRQDILSANEQQRDEMVRHALTKQRTLLIIDNLETVDDERVISFIKEVPAPTKVIVTTRHRIDVAYPIRLLGMNLEEAQELIRDESVKKDVRLTGDEIERLIIRTGGIPLAIVWSIAQVALGYSPQATLNRLGNPTSDISKFCFEGVLDNLRGTPAYYLLMGLAYLGNNASREMLGRAAGLPELDRDEGLILLERLSLINKRGNIFHVLPLTLAYCNAEIDKHPELRAQISLPFLMGYLERIKHLYGTTQILGQVKPLTLDQTFVNPLVRPLPKIKTASLEVELGYETSVGRDTNEPVSAIDVIDQYDKLVILGHPGAGKTMLMKFIAVRTANDFNRIPIFISLKEWADSGFNLFEYASSWLGSSDVPSPKENLQTLLRSGSAILLFDGLDEVVEGFGGGDELVEYERKRSHVIAEINQFCRSFDKCKYVITTRIAASSKDEFDGFRYFKIEDFDEAQVAEFVEKWFGPAKQKSSLFLDKLRSNRNLVELSHSPLFLIMLCLVFDETLSFGESKAELYEVMVDLLLKKWDSSRSVKRDEIYRGLSTGRKRQLLSHVAAKMFVDSSYYITQSELEGLIGAYISHIPEVRQNVEVDLTSILKSIEAQHGILIERSQGIYSFSMLVLQEYLAAKYFADQFRVDSSEILLEHLFEPRWREVILLTISLLPSADEFCGLLLEKQNKMLAGDKELKRYVMSNLKRHLIDGRSAVEKWQSVMESILNKSNMKSLGFTDEHIPTLRTYLSICDILIHGVQFAYLTKSSKVEIENAVLRISSLDK